MTPLEILGIILLILFFFIIIVLIIIIVNLRKKGFSILDNKLFYNLLVDTKVVRPVNEVCQNLSYLPYDTTKPDLLGLQLALNATYTNCPNISTLPIPSTFSNVQSFINPNTKTIVGYGFTNDTCVYLVFAGSLTEAQWLSDLDSTQIAPIGLKGYEIGILAHQGFYTEYLSVQSQIQTYVNKYYTNCLKIIGHSRGSGITDIATLDFTDKKPIVTTYAGPRSLNVQGAQKVANNSNYISYINSEDIVPYTPLPISDNVLYEHIPGTIKTFTDNTGLGHKNHVDAYLNYLQNIQ